MKVYSRLIFFSVCVAVLLGTPADAEAQQKTDSLKRILQNQKVDSNYVRILITIARLYNTSNADSTLFYGQKALKCARDLKSKPMESQAHLHIGYAWYMKGDYDKSMAAFRDLYNTAASLNNYQDMAIGLNNEANGYIEKGDYKHALENYKRSQEIARQANDEVGIARASSNISFVNKELGNYAAAIENYITAQKIYENKKMHREVALMNTNIAMVYYRQKNYPLALEYITKALTTQKEYDLKDGMAISMGILSAIYANQQKYTEAIAFNKMAMDIYQSQKDIRQLASSNSNLGELFNRQGNNDSAILYYSNSIKLYRQIGNMRGLANAYNGSANVLVNKRELKAAADLLDSSKAIWQKTGRKEDIKEYYDVLSKYYEAAGNHNEALASYKKFTEIKDSILNIENTKAISEINTKYETEKKQAQIEKLDHESIVNNLTIKNQQLSLNERLYELAAADLKLAQNDIVLKDQQGKILKNRIDSIQAKQAIDKYSADIKLQQLTVKNQQLTISRKNMILTVSVIIFVLLLLLVYISYRRYKLKQRNHTQALLMKQQDLAAQEVIQAEEKERKRIAADLHDGVGQLMSAAKMNLSAIQSQMNFTTDQQKQIFESAINMVDDSCREVRNISHHMMPNALLKSGLVAAVREFVQRIADNVLRIQLHAEGLNETIDKNTEIILYRVLQECVHNVIKHAHASQLDISLIRDDDGISITVEDNGNGFNTSDTKNFSGLGLSNMTKRIEYLKGTIEWSSDKGKGTLVSIHVPA